MTEIENSNWQVLVTSKSWEGGGDEINLFIPP
jgi:hypothetical protein